MVQLTLLGIPYDDGSSHIRGAADAPPLIRKALWSPASNLWSEVGVDCREHLADAGDLHFPDQSNVREVIEDGVRLLLNQGACPIILGGDHSISYPILRAIRQVRPGLNILHLDAHPDLYEEYEGDRYSHACPFARVMEEGLASRLVQIGIRTMNGHQQLQVERYGVEVVTMRQWTQGIRPELQLPVYLSIDLDVIDPGFAPGVAHPEPGGMSVRDVIEIVHSLAVPILGADIVEYNPRRDVLGLTALVAAKLVKEIVGKVVVIGSTGAM